MQLEHVTILLGGYYAIVTQYSPHIETWTKVTQGLV